MKRDLPLSSLEHDMPHSEDSRGVSAPGKPIGQIIRDVRPLSDADLDHILVVQKRMGVRFGEAAVALALVSQKDVMWALSQQFRYPFPREPGILAASEMVVASDPFGAQAEAFRELRSSISAAQQLTERRPLAVLSQARGDGRSFVAANLALAFCQLGERTVLVDANLRSPGIHKLLGIPERPSLSSLLSGMPLARPFDRSAQMPQLYVLQAGTPPPNPVELLDRPLFGRLLGELQRNFDRVIVDTACASGTADARVVASACRQAVLVGRKHHTPALQLNSLKSRLHKVGVDVVGVILNDH
ncbi:MAG: polysaccharide biosynthesis tyrosine autokinase [Leptothrix sp. (in: Bacteria)]|nr:polysaccharide biosynthesis tyrosine autokinase [Leptothrix sp. (in: b-proteobacteria)]